MQAILFTLGGQTYAVEVGCVREIQPLDHLTPIPCTPAHILGVMNLRGTLCPVLHLAALFCLPEGGLSPSSQVLILQSEGVEMGLLADSVLEVCSISPDRVEPSPGVSLGLDPHYVAGLLSAPSAVLISAKNLLTDPRLTINDPLD